MKWGVVALVFLLTMSFAMALQGPITANGKEYYVVTSTDPTEDTGNEVCAKVGQICVGFTDSTGTVCGQVHQGVTQVTSLSGDQSTVYCDGAPQTGECAKHVNSCVTCPSCSVSVGCDTEIGGLYREMYAECAAPQANTCPVQLLARDTDAFINEISRLNAAMASCPYTLPSGTSFIAGSGNVQVDLTRNNGQLYNFYVSMQNKQAVGINVGTNTCSQRLSMTENVFDRILSNKDRGAEFMRAYGNKEIKVTGCSFFRSFVNFFTQPVARFIVRRNTPPPPPPTPVANCGALNEQCNNRACQTGLTCASPRVWQGGRWVAQDFRCIDQRQYDVYCTPGNNVGSAWDCLSGSYCR